MSPVRNRFPLLEKSLSELEQAVRNEDEMRAIELLSHIVPEYSGANHAEQATSPSAPAKAKSKPVLQAE